jgi:hypothetical protein
MLQPILAILPWLELYLRSRRPIIRRGAPPHRPPAGPPKGERA